MKLKHRNDQFSGDYSDSTSGNYEMVRQRQYDLENLVFSITTRLDEEKHGRIRAMRENFNLYQENKDLVDYYEGLFQEVHIIVRKLKADVDKQRANATHKDLDEIKNRLADSLLLVKNALFLIECGASSSFDALKQTLAQQMTSLATLKEKSATMENENKSNRIRIKEQSVAI
ncbi:hypothetical protein Ciccas_013122, partial [Cichlidogyrus casuarinus]